MIKPLLFSCLLLETFSVYGSAAESSPADFFRSLEAKKPQVVVLYGTSLTAGGAWASAFKKWFDQEYPGLVTVFNNSGSGKNSQWAVENLDEKILKVRPDLVLMEFSYNDAHDKFNMSVKDGWQNLDRMVKKMKQEKPETVIVLQVMNVGWDAPNGNKSASARPKLQEFNDNYRRYAQENSLPLIDHYPIWLKLKEEEADKFQQFVPDGTHPSAEGSLAVTWPAVKAFFTQAQQAARTAAAPESATPSPVSAETGAGAK
jgi:lysophospholipase L1-like esterase